MNTRTLKKFVITACLAATAWAAHASPTLIVNADGRLTGAKSVNVQGSLYDVKLTRGTCVGLFSGCDASNDFFFTDAASATAATQALLDTVFTGIYDDPNRTAGCEGSFRCGVFTPFAFVPGEAIPLVDVGRLLNEIPGTFFADSVDVFRTAAQNTVVWAQWSSAAAVPVPGTVALVALGLAGLAATVRRRGQRWR